MSRHSDSRRWRDRLPGRSVEPHFRWRGKEVSRLENLADAAFGFSVTLLVVALEAPRDFPGLKRVLEGFPAFIACFAMLMFFWNAHYRFFRRYGLEDTTTRMLNYAILLIVIFAVYPLKFLFTVWFAGMFGLGANEAGAGIRNLDELRFVFRVYGSGLALTWGLFGLLYSHAFRQRHQLQLTRIEELHTLANIAGFAVCIGVSLLSIVCTLLPIHQVTPGLVYFLIGPGLGLSYAFYGRRINQVLAQQRTNERR